MSIQSILYDKGSEVITVDRDASIEQAAELMRDHHIGALPVTAARDVVGMITRREIVDGFARNGGQLAGLHVADLMQRNFLRTTPQESLRRVMTLMTRHHATHVPVFSGDQLVGVVSGSDVVKHRLEDLELESNQLRDSYSAAH
ncbi:MAG TPA: CBS domain-containing protein [Rhizomicrobium sp.]|jgi:CBS domain-containing protein|nr:CBS domain-containing protein [Rhizomicrobium sp.]